MDVFRKTLAPITAEAWAMIEEQARETLQGNLSARSLVDVDGPLGMEVSAVNLGTVKYAKEKVQGVSYGLREILPLVEIQVPFELPLAELDTISRGLRNPDLKAVAQAAAQAATFEESAIYQGFAKAGIAGIAANSDNKPISLPNKSEDIPKAIETAVLTLQKNGVGGPYELVLGTAPYAAMMESDRYGNPVRQIVGGIIGGSVSWSPAVKGGVLLSGRGGDFLLTLGQDMTIGYQSSNNGSVQFYLTETFTFQTLTPEAAVELK